MTAQPTNQEIARVLDRIADLLEAQDANPFRIRAYRNAARQAREMDQSLAGIAARGGVEALRDLPHIGRRIADIIDEYRHKGYASVLLRLEGEVVPEDLFAQVPGIGPELAGRIVDRLHLHSLEELELAAHDGRLAGVPGFGAKRVQAVRTSLAAMLSRSAHRRAARRTGALPPPAEEPSVALLLAIDAEYRQKAEAGDLKTIAPRRFNPGGRSWLPIYHTEREGWEFTAMFSNTRRAHELGRTDDWVIIYFEHDHQEGQHTVVTETYGPLEGRRVVRGREGECRAYYLAE